MAVYALGREEGREGERPRESARARERERERGGWWCGAIVRRFVDAWFEG